MDLELQTVLDRYSAPLYRPALSYLSNPQDAEDGLQEVFSKYISICAEDRTFPRKKCGVPGS